MTLSRRERALITFVVWIPNRDINLSFNKLSWPQSVAHSKHFMDCYVIHPLMVIIIGVHSCASWKNYFLIWFSFFFFFTAAKKIAFVLFASWNYSTSKNIQKVHWLHRSNQQNNVQIVQRMTSSCHCTSAELWLSIRISFVSISSASQPNQPK